jgi:hypothetical protein
MNNSLRNSSTKPGRRIGNGVCYECGTHRLIYSWVTCNDSDRERMGWRVPDGRFCQCGAKVPPDRKKWCSVKCKRRAEYTISNAKARAKRNKKKV